MARSNRLVTGQCGLVASPLAWTSVSGRSRNRSSCRGADRSGSGTQLVHPQQFAGGEQVIAERGTAGLVEGADPGFGVFGQDGENCAVGDGIVVKQIRAVARNHDLGQLAGVGEAVDEDAGGGGMQSALRFFDALPDDGVPSFRGCSETAPPGTPSACSVPSVILLASNRHGCLAPRTS